MASQATEKRGYGWARAGDINAFFGLMLDNVAVLVLLLGAITSNRSLAQQEAEGLIFFTPGFVLLHMIPGTALGVLLGDLIYTALAFRLARRRGRDDVTAMPLGLDTPSTFGVAFLVLLPALQEGYRLHSRDHEPAMRFAWQVGLLVLVFSGLFKLACAPLGNAVRRLVPRAGLLGSLAAIALALIAFLPLALEGIAALPLVGMLALAVILWTLVAHRPLPGKVPGALAAVLLGTAVYQAGLLIGERWSWPLVPPLEHSEAALVWQPGAWMAFWSPSESWSPALLFALGKLPVMLPFALATIIGGIDCTESAAAAGDEYDTRGVLLTEAAATLLAGLCGGVIQTTPYIGHPAYKKMGGRAAYTLATALFVGVVGCLGGFPLLFAWLPKAALFPILVFVGLEITAQSFHATPARHYPAVALAMLPALAYLITIPLNMALGMRVPEPAALPVVQTLRCLSGGFLITSMLWAAALVMLLEDRPLASAAYFALAGLAAFFGVIHSPLVNEQIGLPWHILPQVAPAFREAVRFQTPYHWAGAYGLIVLLLLGLAVQSRRGPGTPAAGGANGELSFLVPPSPEGREREAPE